MQIKVGHQHVFLVPRPLLYRRQQRRHAAILTLPRWENQSYRIPLMVTNERRILILPTRMYIADRKCGTNKNRLLLWIHCAILHHRFTRIPVRVLDTLYIICCHEVCKGFTLVIETCILFHIFYKCVLRSIQGNKVSHILQKQMGISNYNMTTQYLFNIPCKLLFKDTK